MPTAFKPNSIRVEKDGRWRDIPYDAIFAVRANAHYTLVHDGEHEYFCNLSISAIEERLDRTMFQRVHRSHIVAIRRIARLKRAGETHVAELGSPVRCSIPIARTHYRDLCRQIEAFVT